MDVFDLTATIRLEVDDYLSGLKIAENKTSSFSSGLSKLAKFGAAALAGATTAMVGFGASAVSAGRDFDQSMAQVAATMGKTVADMAKETGTAMVSVNGQMQEFSGNLREFAQYLGQNTAFSATQAADALNYMALAGYNTQQSMDMLPNVLSLAAAGAMDLAAASDMVTDTQTAFGITAERTTQMVDEMAKAASTGNTSVSQLGNAFLVIGGLAKDLNGGMVTLADGTQQSVDGLQELEIALTTMANAGIKGSEAGTHMRNMLLKLSSPTEGGTAALKEMGVQIFDTEGKMRSLSDIFGEMKEGMASWTQERKIQALSEIFNTRDVAAAQAILGQVDTKWDEIGEALLNAEGAASKMADTQLDNLAGDITLFRSALEGAQIAVSDQLTPALREFVQFGTRGLSELTAAFTEGGLDAAMAKFGELLSDGLAMVVQGLPGAINAGAQLLGTLAEGIIENLPQIAAAATQVVGVLADAIFEGIPYIFDKIGTLLPAAVNGLIQLLPKALARIQKALPKITKALVKLVKNIVKALPTILKSLLTALPQMLNMITDILVRNGDIIINGIMEIIGMVVDQLPDILSMIVTAMPALIKAIVKSLVAAIPQLTRATVQLFMALVKALPDIVKAIAENLPMIIESIIDAFSEAGPELIEAFKMAFSTLVDNLPVIAEALWNGLTTIGTALWDKLSWILQNPGEALTEAGDWLASAIFGEGTTTTDVKNALQEWWDTESVGAIAKEDWEDIWGGTKLMLKDFGNWLLAALFGGDVTVDDVVGGLSEWWNTKSVGALKKEDWKDIVSGGILMGNEFGSWFLRDLLGLDLPDTAFQPVWEWAETLWRFLKTAWKLKVEFPIKQEFYNLKQAWDNFWAGIWAGITETWESAKEKIEGIWENIKSYFHIDDALEWGKDLINNFIEGITDALPNFEKGIKAVGKLIKDNLGHSHPKEGPLADDYTWMPDMMNLFAQGIDDNAWRVNDAVTSAFDFKDKVGSGLQYTAASAPYAAYDPFNPYGLDQRNMDSVYLQKMVYLMEQMLDRGMDVTLEGDARDIFRVVEKQNTISTKATGYNRLSMSGVY